MRSGCPVIVVSEIEGRRRKRTVRERSTASAPSPTPFSHVWRPAILLLLFLLPGRKNEMACAHRGPSPSKWLGRSLTPSRMEDSHYEQGRSDHGWIPAVPSEGNRGIRSFSTRGKLCAKLPRVKNRDKKRGVPARKESRGGHRSWKAWLAALTRTLFYLQLHGATPLDSRATKNTVAPVDNKGGGINATVVRGAVVEGAADLCRWAEEQQWLGRLGLIPGWKRRLLDMASIRDFQSEGWQWSFCQLTLHRQHFGHCEPAQSLREGAASEGGFASRARLKGLKAWASRHAILVQSNRCDYSKSVALLRLGLRTDNTVRFQRVGADCQDREKKNVVEDDVGDGGGQEEDDAKGSRSCNGKQGAGKYLGTDTSRRKRHSGAAGGAAATNAPADGVRRASVSVSWDEMVGRLRRHLNTAGDAGVPQQVQDPRLGRWATQQRVARRKGSLSCDRIEALDHVGFVWNLKTDFKCRLAELKRFREENGHVLVPRRNGTRGLNSWLTAQRFKKARGTLKHEEELELEAVGVKWEVRRSWSEMLKLLQSFKQEHGNCDVPQGYPDVPGLGAWVTYQRVLRRSNRLEKAKMNELDKLGFEWSPNKMGIRSAVERNERAQTPSTKSQTLDLNRQQSKGMNGGRGERGNGSTAGPDGAESEV